MQLHRPTSCTKAKSHAPPTSESYKEVQHTFCASRNRAYISICKFAGCSSALTRNNTITWSSSANNARTHGTAQRPISYDVQNDIKQDCDPAPITAATAAAQASTAQGKALQAASAAQEVSADARPDDGAEPSSIDDNRPKRDAFSTRDALLSSSTPLHNATDAALEGSASSKNLPTTRRIRERLRLDRSLQPTPSHADGSQPSNASEPPATSHAHAEAYDAIGTDLSADDHHQDFSDLLTTPDEGSIGRRARSASDANVLRRKGHLKEQDAFISFLLRMHETHSCQEVMEKMEKWIREHRRDPRGSQLSRMVPALGSFFTPLKLVAAFEEYDEFFALSRRKYVQPNFAELRHVLNIAQVHASAGTLKLVTFDADGTLYADGEHMEQDNRMIRHMVDLMRSNIHVAIVTAAGYPGEAQRFEQRVEGLLAAFRDLRLPDAITNRFHIVGGECNYLLRVGPSPDRRLQFVEDEEWKSPYMMSWTDDDVKTVLDNAEALLVSTAAHLRLPVDVVRKQRSVGVVPRVHTIYEVLEELAITTQSQLRDRVPLPFCAFNGGADVFVDLGNKSLGLEALLNYLGVRPQHALHVGDRFTASGNDMATRDCCCILWVAGPGETNWFVELLLVDLFVRSRDMQYVE